MAKTIQKKYGRQVKYYAKGGWPYTGLTYSNKPLSDELILPEQENQYSNWGDPDGFKLPEVKGDFFSAIGKLEQAPDGDPIEPLKNPVGKTASAKAGIAGAAFDAVGKGLETLAPPDSKFGKAMQKGNSFAKAAEPLKMLDMAVPGLGTGLTAGASLIGAIVGGVQAKNEEIDTNRIEKNTDFLKKYQNLNFDRVSQGNRMAEEGYNVQGSDDQLIQEIFQDFDRLLGIQGPQMRYGGKLYANEGFTVPNNYTASSGTRKGPSYVPPNVLGIQGKTPEQTREITDYMDFDQSELYQFKDNDSLKELIPINTPGYTASRVNPIYRKIPDSRQYIPLSKRQYERGLSFIE